ncbi:MAG: TolC family protein [Bacteroidales bacterium]|nr:TolC family protein [Bacteroidales bacterium]
MYRFIILVITVALSCNIYGQGESLSLSSALELALENNYGIKIAAKDSEVAGINNDWGAAGRYPTVGFDATSSNNQNFSDKVFTSRLNAGIGLRWTIFDGFKVSLTKDKLGQLEDLARGREELVIESTIEDVILGYYQVILNEKRLAVLEKVMTLSEDRYKYEQTRQEFGNAVTYNVLQAKNNYLNDKATYLNQQVTYRNSVRSLNFMMGLENNMVWSLTEEFIADVADYQVSDLLDKMMSGNRSLMNQYISIVLAQNASELSESNFFPSLSLSAGLDNSNNFLPELSRGSSLSAYANVTFAYDIYQAGQRKRAVEIAKIDESITGVEEEEMKRSLTNQLLSLFDMYNVRKELLSISGENLEAAELNMQIAEEKYRSGAINSFNYRDIQLIYLNAAYQEIQSVYNLISSQTSLTRITGGFIKPGSDK